MWGVIDESSDNPLAELWGLFKSMMMFPGSIGLYVLRLIRKRSFLKRADQPGMPSECAPSARFVSNA